MLAASGMGRGQLRATSGYRLYLVTRLRRNPLRAHSAPAARPLQARFSSASGQPASPLPPSAGAPQAPHPASGVRFSGRLTSGSIVSPPTRPFFPCTTLHYSAFHCAALRRGAPTSRFRVGRRRVYAPFRSAPGKNGCPISVRSASRSFCSASVRVPAGAALRQFHSRALRFFFWNRNFYTVHSVHNPCGLKTLQTGRGCWFLKVELMFC